MRLLRPSATLSKDGHDDPAGGSLARGASRSSPVPAGNDRVGISGPSLLTLAAFAIGLLGAVLRIAHYLEKQALHMDEIALALNIRERALPRLLLEPLDYFQTAPAGFLLLEKLVVGSLGGGEFAWRLVPLLAALASLPLFWRLSTQLVDRTTALLAFFLFATCVPLLPYAAQVKQYSLDVLVGLVLAVIVVHELARARNSGRPLPARRQVWLGAAGLLLVPFSQTSVFLLPALGIALFVNRLEAVGARPAAAIRDLLPVGLLWGLGVAGTALLSLHVNPTEARVFFHQYWDDGIAFLPRGDFARALAWPFAALFEQVRTLDYDRPLPLLWRYAHLVPVLYLVLAGLGLVALWRRAPLHFVIVAGPAAVTLAASALHLFPFSGRVILFLMPFLMIAIASGIVWVASELLARAGRAPAALFAVGALAAPVNAVVQGFPIQRVDDIPQALAYIARHREPADPIYVYYLAAPGTTAYGQSMGFDEREFDIGGCHWEERREYFRELDAYRGRARVWLLIAHAPYDENEFILDYLDTIGRRLQTFSVGRVGLDTAKAVLFALDDPQRLARTNRRDYFLKRGEAGDPRFAICDKGPMAVNRDFRRVGKLLR